MKRLLITALLAAVLLSGILPTAGAKDQTCLIGDADGDGVITILDATKVQRVLVGLDQDKDGMIYLRAGMAGKTLDILDATTIQRYLVGYSSKYPIGQTKTFSLPDPVEPTRDEYEMPIVS